MYILLAKALKFLVLPLLLLGLVMLKFKALLQVSANLGRDAKKLRDRANNLRPKLVKAIAENKNVLPMESDKKTVFLIVTCGQAIRTILVSDVYAKLKLKYNLVIITPYYESRSFRETYEADSVHVVPWFDNYVLGLELIVGYWHMYVSSSGTLQSIRSNIEANALDSANKRLQVKAQKKLKAMQYAALFGRLLGRKALAGVHNLFLWVFMPHDIYAKLFSAYKPHLVLSTAAHHSAAWPIVQYAARKRVPTAAFVISWDNLTTKSVLDEYATNYLLWSEEMQEEMRKHFPFISAKTHVVGTPQFDMYFDKKHLKLRNEFVAILGLEADKPYILWATNTPIAMPEEPEILLNYWRAIQQSEMAELVNLVVRLHPKDRIERYEQLGRLPRVAITLAGPPEWRDADHWLPDNNVIAFMLNQMAHASVSINVASTMSLEGFCLNLPTINIAYTGVPEMKRSNALWSFDLYHSSDHYKALVDADSLIVVRSQEELLTATRECLEGPSSRAPAMQAVLRQKAAYSDGSAAERFVEVINGIVG